MENEQRRPFEFGQKIAQRVREEARVRSDVSFPLSDIERMATNNANESFWTEDFTEKLAYIARVHGALYAERFLEHLEELPTDEEGKRADIDSYASLTERAFRRLGRSVGSEFSRSYPEVLKQGFASEQYYDEVEQAATNGGKVFAKSYAYFLPSVMKQGESPRDFRIASTQVKRASNLPMATTFMSNAERVAWLENTSIKDAASTTLESLERIGIEATRWGYPGIQLLSEYTDYTQEEYFKDAEDIRNNLNPSYTSWFAAGMLRLGNEHSSIANLPKQGIRTNDWTVFDYPSYSQQERKNLFSPEQFKESFMRLAHLGKKSSSVLFARTFDPMNIKDSEDFIYDASEELGKKPFRDVAWLIQQTANFNKSLKPKQLRAMLGEFVELHRYGKDEVVNEVLAYNTWLIKNKIQTDGVALPESLRLSPNDTYDVREPVYAYLDHRDREPHDEIPF